MAKTYSSAVLVGPVDKGRAWRVLRSTGKAAPWTTTRLSNRLKPQPLPPLLAGPILRRVDRDEVYVWFATSLPVTADGWVRERGSRKTNPDASGTTASFRFLKNLHISLLRMVATRKLPVDRWLEYNVTITPKPRLDGEQPFFDGPVFLDKDELCIGGFQNPAFVIPGDRSRDSFMHASCRKLHGEGEDAAKRAWEHFERIATRGPAGAPSHLILGGDQVYADDVATPVSAAIREVLAPALVGGLERLPWMTDSSNPTLRETVPTALFVEGKRGSFVRKNGFTADEAEAKNHLMGVGDYAALYLLAWSPDLWFWSDVDKKLGSFAKNNKGSRYMRRLLANVSTYMAFDDHDVTDDWNLSRDWRDDVRGSGATRRIVSNALAAFWAFQALGNDPKQMSPLRSTIVDALPASTTSTSFDDKLWGFHSWSYTAPTHPPSIVLDTRTQRVLDKRKDAPPGLMNPSAIRWLRSEFSKLKSTHPKAEPLVILSPVPVLGWLIEDWQSVLQNVNSGRKLKTSLDPESWGFHEETFIEFLDALSDSTFSRIVFLSGDVHYGFTAYGHYRERQTNGKFRTTTLVQMTSSSMKNGIDRKGRGLMRVPESEIRNGKRLQLASRRWKRDGRSRRAVPSLSDDYDFELQYDFVRAPERSVAIQSYPNPLTFENNVGFVKIDRKGAGGTAAQTLVHAEKGQTVHSVEWGKIPDRLRWARSNPLVDGD